MKVLFVLPQYGRGNWEFPYAFAYLSSYAKKHIPDIQIDYFDTNHGSMAELYEKYKKEHHNVIAFTGLTSHYASIKELVKYFRENKDDKTMIFVGGTIISSYPEFMIKHLGADYYVLGEGEEAFCECLQNIAENKSINQIKNVGYLENGKVIINESRELIADLDQLPWQDYESFGYDEVMKHNGYSAMMFASRGCPFNCGFCYRLYGSAYRTRGIESVLAEMEYLIKKYKVYRFAFADELFFLNRDRIEKFCLELINKRWGITWNCSIRANLAEPRILKLMRKSGCIQLSFGIESGNQRMLEKMNKRTKVEDNINAIKLTKQADIFPGLNLIIGYPGETKESIEDTARMLYETKSYGGLHFIQALPGTALYNEVRKMNFIRDEEKYFLSLQDEILGLPMDFTGLGKEFIEKTQKQIMGNCHKYYVHDYNRFRWNCFKHYLRHGNKNYFRFLPERVVKGIGKRVGIN
jgi:anaerobic magnesium-protoporphyrin IX monomethyl ester cyclase